MSYSMFEAEVLSQIGGINARIDTCERSLKSEIKAVAKHVDEVDRTLNNHVLKDEITQSIKNPEKGPVPERRSRITPEDIKSAIKVLGFVGAMAGASFMGSTSCDDLQPQPAIHKDQKVEVVREAPKGD